jgi:hypothetical protein
MGLKSHPCLNLAMISSGIGADFNLPDSDRRRGDDVGP